MVRMIFAFLGLVLAQNISFAANAPHYWIGEENGKSYLYRQGTVGIKKAPITILDPTRSYFHWTNIGTSQRWNRQGLNREEYQYLRHEGQNQAAGGGLYISKDPLNSASFGMMPIAVKLNDGSKVVMADGDFFTELQNPQAIADLLESMGLDAWEYRELGSPTAWVNILRYEAIQSLSALKYDDIHRLPSLTLNSVKDLRNMIWLDRFVDFASHPESLTRFPYLGRILNHALLDSEREAIGAESKMQVNFLTSYFYNPLSVENIKPYEGGGLATFTIRQIFGELTLARLKQEPLFSQMIQTDRRLYLSLSTVLPRDLLPPCTTCGFTRNYPGLAIQTGLSRESETRNSFAMDYIESFEFIDLPDMIHAQIENDGAPWKRYDQQGAKPFLERWRNAKRKFMADNGKGGFLVDDYLSTNLTSSLDKLTELNQILSGDTNSRTRGLPMVEGGHNWIGKKSYYRVPLENLEALKANPFLTLEIVDEPDLAKRGTSVLVRHEYPSARTYKRFQNLLSPELLKKLQTADAAGALLNDAHPDTQALTRLVLESLWKKVPLYSEKLFYQAAISLSPFENFNTHTMRALYYIKAQKPLILRNFDWALLLNTQQFSSEIYASDLFHENLIRELSQIEKQNPDFPRFYEAKSPSVYFFDNGDITQIQKQSFLTESMHLFSKTKTQDVIGEKHVSSFGNLDQSDCANIMTGMVLNP